MTSSSHSKVAATLFAFAALTACQVLSKSAGIDVGTNGRIGGSADVDLIYFIPEQSWSLNAVARVRAGSPFFDTGFGLGGCGHVDSLGLGICGRVFLVELGSYSNKFTVGSGSPQFFLVRPFPIGYQAEHDTYRHMLVARLGAGYDVRPLNEWNGSTPYVNASFGYFF